MRAAIKCVHPLFLIGIAVFVLLLVGLQVEITDIFSTGKAGPCDVPVFLLFVHSEFMILLGFGFSAIRVFELSSKRRKSPTHALQSTHLAQSEHE